MKFDMNQLKRDILRAVEALVNAKIAEINDEDPVKSVGGPADPLTNAIFYRYVRPLYTDKSGVVQLHPTKGVTLRFNMDYVTRCVSVSYSICDGDLFSKQIGREIAAASWSDRCIMFSIPDGGFDCNGIVASFVKIIHDARWQAGAQRASVDDIIKQYRDSKHR